MSPFSPEGDLRGTPVLFSPSVRRMRCSQVRCDVLRQEAAILKYAPLVIRTLCAQKPAPFPGMACDVLTPLQLPLHDLPSNICDTTGQGAGELGVASWRSHGVRGLNQNRFQAGPELEEFEQQRQEQTRDAQDKNNGGHGRGHQLRRKRL